MKSLSEIISWLKTPDHIRVILVEISDVIVEGAPSTFYLSNKSFTTLLTDTPSSKTYDSCIVGSVSFNEAIDLEGNPTIGYGDLEIANYNGERDSWLNYIWANRSAKIYIGDPRWAKSDYYLIFDGVISDISSRDQNTLNIILLNKLDRLNNPITEEVLGGTGNNKDRIKPLVFGECFNIDPLNTDSEPNVLEYMVHNGPIEDIIEVRDKGMPVSINKNLSQGKFTLNHTPAGQITASVQGYKPSTYSNNVVSIVRSILTNYGPTTTRLTLSDIDTANFSSFESTYTNPVGFYCKDRTNILDLCQKLLASFGITLTCTSAGLMRLVRLTLPSTSATTWTVNSDDMVEDSFTVQEKPEVKGSVKLNYCKNWTPQQATALAGAVNPASVTLFERDWLSTLATSSSVITNYKLNSEPIAEDTYFLTEAPTSAEAIRRLNLWSTPRFIYTATYFSHLLPVELGDRVLLSHRRYGLVNKECTVVNIDRNWITGRVIIGVLA